MAKVIHGRHIYKLFELQKLMKYFDEVNRRIHVLLTLRRITPSLGMFHVRNHTWCGISLNTMEVSQYNYFQFFSNT